MLLLVGLGNPGSQYARHRHNVGFLALDTIHNRHGFAPWRHRFKAETSEGRLGNTKCLLIKPQTYMNESGRAVGEAARFYKIDPLQIVVVHDEVDLPPGKFRMKAGGGVAGHNGLKSVRAAVGDNFRRLRIGIGHPGHREAVPHYVLHDFAKADRTWLVPLLDAIGEHAPLLAEEKDSTFANRINEALRAEPGKTPAATTSAKNTPKRTPEAEPETEGALARGLRKLLGR
jgi:PTH1 family peptidyl-tRNA hydrolase